MSVVLLSELIEGLRADVRNIDTSIAISSIGHDSRSVQSTGNPIFFAIRGNHVDANLFISDVLQKNPNTIVISEDPELSRGIVVKDLSLSMAIIARRFFHAPDRSMDIIAVTGTNGKTTTGFLTRHLLNSHSKAGLLGTIEYDLGDGNVIEAINTTPLAPDFYYFLDQCRKNGCQSVVFEASSHAIDQNRIHDVSLKVAIFTNLSQEHLDYHHTLEQYFLTKSKLFNGQNGEIPRYSVINVDDPYGKRLIKQLANNDQAVLSFGESEDADFQIVNIQEDVFRGARFGIKHDGAIDMFSTHLFGRHNISNAAASICAAYCTGLQMDDIKDALADFTNVPGRLERMVLKNGAVVFIDYAHTPAALKVVLSVLRPHITGRLITVFGCGGDRDRTKRAPMTNVVTSLSDYTIATADNPRSEPLEQIFSDMKIGIHDGANIEFIDDRYLAIAFAINLSHAGDVVLIAGRGHENGQKIGDRVIHFNDKEVVKELDA